VFRQLKTSFLMLVAMTVLTGIIYPLAITGLAHILFPKQANGSLIVRGGRVIGSELLGQSFDDPKHFWGRPSATAPFPYNSAASAGSNFGPLNPDLAKNMEARRRALRAADPGNDKPIPIDLVTSSASGLDPHISPEAAEFQVARVARNRGVPIEVVRALVAKYTRGRQWGFLGEPTVNVLMLNLALDRQELLR
jgi:potassium-transporting ATPase KdpC subunit